MDIYETRRANLRRLMADWGGPTSLSAKLGHSNGSFLAQLVGPHPSREISEKVARGIEAKMGLPLGWLDGPVRERPAIDDTLLAQCVRAVTGAMGDAKVKAKPDQFAELVALAYEHAAPTGTCSEVYINKIVRLLK